MSRWSAIFAGGAQTVLGTPEAEDRQLVVVREVGGRAVRAEEHQRVHRPVVGGVPTGAHAAERVASDGPRVDLGGEVGEGRQRTGVEDAEPERGSLDDDGDAGGDEPHEGLLVSLRVDPGPGDEHETLAGGGRLGRSHHDRVGSARHLDPFVGGHRGEGGGRRRHRRLGPDEEPRGGEHHDGEQPEGHPLEHASSS
jgi:hypothetical protein